MNSSNGVTQSGGTFSTLTARTYTFTATDGNSCTATTTATVNQNAAVAFNTPSVTDVKCNGGNDGKVIVSATGGTNSFSYSVNPSNGVTQSGGTFSTLTARTYTFTATDGNSCTATTTATVSQPPVLSFGSPSITRVSCLGGSNGSVIVSATGGMGMISYTISPNVGIQSPSGTFNGLTAQTYTFTATDGNGCQTTTTAFVPNGVPLINCPQPISININQLNSSGNVLPNVTGELSFASFCYSANQITYTDRIYNVYCGAVTSGDGSPANINNDPNNTRDAVRIISRLFNATNTGSSISYHCSQLIYIRSVKLTEVAFPSDQILLCANSSTAPENALINGVIVAGTGFPSITGQILGQGLSKNISTSYTDERITNANGFTIKRTWIIKNDCTGETRSMVQNLTFRNDAGTCPPLGALISGNIKREDLMDVPAKIMIYNAANDSINSTIGSSYSFNNLLINNRYRIAPERPNSDWNNGVTTFDIALISRHILGISTFTSPYQLIAADVNRSGEVDAADMLLLQRLILRIAPTFPNNNSWRFVLKNYAFQDLTNPFGSDFPETLIVPNLIDSITNGDFVAIKVGDVNQSLGSVNIRGGIEPFALAVEDMVLEKNKTYEIPIRMTPSVFALQYAISVDKKAARIESVSTGNLPNFTDNNIGLFKNDGIVTAAWYRSSNQKFDEKDTLTMFNLVITPKENTRLSQILSINPTFTEGVAYDELGKGTAVKLSFGNTYKQSSKPTLLPSRPNPFSDETTISFLLNETGFAKLSVCDMFGKVLMTTEKEFSKGLNEVIFNAKNTPSVSSGILVVRLQTANGLSEQKIVFSN